ncbi:MAG: type I toxin-antitoxin system SymE family toxin [Lachnospiraceae bacterium]|nr:type I toxin-antitoxin system SymE family toxin [Lachnospiraceae bacterium]
MPDTIIPEIRLRGKWLRLLGFVVGENILVTCENDKITIQHETHCNQV